MSEALAIVDQLQRPKGVTKRQMRLAALLPRCETAAEALRLAGYSEATIRNNGYRQVSLGGVKRARTAIDTSLSDSARGFAGASRLALKTAKEDIAALEPRDRIAAAVKFAEVANTLGEHVQDRGDGDRHRYRMRRAIALAYHFGCVATRRAQDVVLSPSHNSVAPAKERNDNPL